MLCCTLIVVTKCANFDPIWLVGKALQSTENDDNKPKWRKLKVNSMKARLESRLAGMAHEMQDFATDLGGWVEAGAQRLSGAEQRRSAAAFSAWALADDGLQDASLRAWIDGLDDIGREALGEQLAGFCTDFEIDLAWLVDGELAAWPALQAQLRTLVTHYCLACKAAVDADSDLIRFRRRRLWQHKQQGQKPCD